MSNESLQQINNSYYHFFTFTAAELRGVRALDDVNHFRLSLVGADFIGRTLKLWENVKILWIFAILGYYFK